MLNRIKNILFLSYIFLASANLAGAQDLGGEINTIYQGALAVGGAAAVIMIVWGAIYITVSGASPDKKSEGKDMIISALIGLVLLFGAALILGTINPAIETLEPPSLSNPTGTP